MSERLSNLVSVEKLSQTMALLLLNPHTPMLFMGEEAAAETPFLFFADWQGEAAELTREGRSKEFAHFTAFASPEMREKIPDPCDERTFLSSKFDWAKLDHAPLSQHFRALTTELLAIRHKAIVPMIKDGFVKASVELLGDPGAKRGLDVRWQTATRDELQLIANFSDESLAIPTLDQAETLWPMPPAEKLVNPWQVVVRRSLRPGG